MDYGKFKYQQSKKLQEAKKKQVHVLLKEVKLRPKTDSHDLEFKINNVKRFLEEGNKAKITLVFRGREITHMDVGRAVIERVAKDSNRDYWMTAPEAKDYGLVDEVLLINSRKQKKA